MAVKAEIDARWADLTRRFKSDSDLSKVVDSLVEGAVDADAADEQPRRRLKVPYANASSLENETGWN